MQRQITQRTSTLTLVFSVVTSLVAATIASSAAAQVIDPTNDEPDQSSEPLLIQNTDTPLTFTFDKEDFDVDVYNQAFDYGSNQFGGLDPAPAAAQLDATEFIVHGVNGNQSPNFGDAQSSGKYANGNSTGGVSNGGLWGFDVDNTAGQTNWAIGLQPTSSDFTSGRLFFCYQNKTGQEVTDANVRFDLHEYNDQAGSMQVTILGGTNTSGCDASQTLSNADKAGGPWSTTGAADQSASWEKTAIGAYFDNLSMSAGSYFVVAVNVSAASGSAPYDEIAIDDPTVAFNPSNALPVELAVFDVKSDGRTAQLQWRTVSERNNAGFAVQHRGATAEWERLGFVEGAGTTTDPQTYRFNSEALDAGRHTFRLKQVDTDGTTHFSEPKTLAIASNHRLRVGGPNPLRQGQTAEVRYAPSQSKTVTLGLYNLLGQRVRTLFEGRVDPAEPLSDAVRSEGLSSGVYFLQVRGDAVMSTRRITVVQ